MDSSHNHIHTGYNGTRNSDNQIQFPLKLARQTAAPVRKQLRTSATRSRGFSSLQLPFLLFCGK
jgi:hypothetical protein